jgi:hypothetical protein
MLIDAVSCLEPAQHSRHGCTRGRIAKRASHRAQVHPGAHQRRRRRRRGVRDPRALRGGGGGQRAAVRAAGVGGRAGLGRARQHNGERRAAGLLVPGFLTCHACCAQSPGLKETVSDSGFCLVEDSSTILGRTLSCREKVGTEHGTEVDAVNEMGGNEARRLRRQASRAGSCSACRRIWPARPAWPACSRLQPAGGA